MKKLLLFFFLLLALVMNVKAREWDFSYQGIMYTVIDDGWGEETSTCRTKHGDIISPYSFIAANHVSGDLQIPSTVEYEGQVYTVVQIGVASFAQLTELTSITLPNTINKISDFAFYGCSGLSNVSFPESVEYIGPGAFSGCRSFTEINLPDHCLVVGDGAFSGCRQVETIRIPTNFSVPHDEFYLWEVEQHASPFTGCKFSTAYFDCVSINSCLKGMTSLTSIHFGDKVRKIGEGAFEGCTGLTEVILPDSIEAIGSGCFKRCSNLREVALPSRMTGIADSLFEDCAGMSKIEIPGTVTSIGNKAFSGCKLEELLLPSISTIGDYAFYNNKLSVLDLPASVTKIGTCAFANNFVQTLILPENLTSCSGDAFEGCPVSKLTINSELSPDEIFMFGNVEEITIGDSVERIPALSSLPALRKVELPSTLTTLPEYAFAGCMSLEEINLPTSLHSIGSSAFENNISLKSIELPSSLTKISAYTFLNCKSLESITLPDQVTSIGTQAFRGCANLEELGLGSELFEISDYAFDGCDNIMKISVKSIIPPFAGSHAFSSSVFNTATVTVPEQSLKLYVRENPWNRFHNYMTSSAGVSLSHYEVEMAGNEVFQLGVYGNQENIIWSSSNPEVAYANECGLIVAMGLTGSTRITATVDGVELTCRVIVSTPTRDKRLAVRRQARISSSTDEEDIEPSDIKVESVKGDPLMMNVRLSPVGACTVMDWQTSDPSRAIIEKGYVTMIADGDVELSAETENGLQSSIVTDRKDISTGIDSIIPTDESGVTVYDLTGRCLIVNGNRTHLIQLNKGVYIVNGKKVMLK